MKKENKSSEYIDIRAMIKEYLSKWYWFVISVVLCAGVAFLYTRISHEKYGVRANMVITSEDDLAVFGHLSNVLGSSARVDDEIFLVSSHSLYKKVAKEMGLNISYFVKKGFLETDFEYKGYPIELYTPAGISDTLSCGIVFKVKANEAGKVSVKVKAKKATIAKVTDATFPVTIETPYGNFTLDKTDNYPVDEDVKTTIALTSYDAAAENLAKNIKSEIMSRKSNVIMLEYDTPYPQFGMELINNILKEYNQRGIDEKKIQGQKSAKFIDERLALLSSDLDVAEGELQKYKENEGFTDLSSEVQYQSEKRGRMEHQLVGAETHLEIIDMVRKFLSDPSNSESLIPITVEIDGLSSLINTYNSLIIKRMNLANTALPGNANLRLLDDQIAAMRDNINTSLDRAYESQTLTVGELRRNQQLAQSRLGNVPSQEREYRDLLRQQRIKQDLYVYLLQRREETSLMLANATPKANIIDEAYTLVDPLTTSRKVILLIGIIIGFLLPPLVLWFKHLFNNKFKTVKELKTITEVPILGEICSDHSKRKIVVREKDNSSIVELFRLMRSNLQFILNGFSDKVVMVTSTSSGEGKSFISVNLSAALSMVDNKRVLLVGLDIRKPRLASYLGINPPYGLTQFLSSPNITFDQLISKVDEIPLLDIVVAGPIPPNPSEMLHSEKLDQFFEIARQRYDYIIVDTAPIGMVSDTFTLNRIADATIIVTRANVTTKSDIDYINEIYDEKRLNKVSIILNDTASKKGYGYGDTSHKSMDFR